MAETGRCIVEKATAFGTGMLMKRRWKPVAATMLAILLDFVAHPHSLHISRRESSGSCRHIVRGSSHTCFNRRSKSEPSPMASNVINPINMAG